MAVIDNLRHVHERIEAACARCGRDPNEVTLVAVTKYAPAAAVRALVEAGQRVLGESRPQQLMERATEWQGAGISWHLIGHLQRNKARRVLPVVERIHSVDRMRLLEALERLAREEGARARVLLEVNLSGEASKDGFDTRSLRRQWERLADLEHVEIAGMMTMAPYAEDPEASRPVFRALRDLRDELADAGPWALPELSMGMSGDFEVAIEEGASWVRVGSVLFE